MSFLFESLSNPVVLKVGRIAPWGRFWWARGETTQTGTKMLDQIIDHSVNFSSLLLWLVSFLQMLVYYDNRLRLLLNNLSIKFYSGSSTYPATVWIFSGLRSRRKNDTAPAPQLFFSWTWLQLRSSSFHEHGSRSGAFGFHECGSGFYSFSYINILIVSVFLKFSGKWIISSTQN